MCAAYFTVVMPAITAHNYFNCAHYAHITSYTHNDLQLQQTSFGLQGSIKYGCLIVKRYVKLYEPLMIEYASQSWPCIAQLAVT